MRPGPLSLARGPVSLARCTAVQRQPWSCLSGDAHPRSNGSPLREVSHPQGVLFPCSWCPKPRLTPYPLQLVTVLHTSSPACTGSGSPPASTLVPISTADVCSQPQGSWSASWVPAEHPCPRRAEPAAGQGASPGFTQEQGHDGQAEAVRSRQICQLWAALSWKEDLPGSSFRAAEGSSRLGTGVPPACSCRGAMQAVPTWGAGPAPRGAMGFGCCAGHGTRGKHPKMCWVLCFQSPALEVVHGGVVAGE